MKYLRIQSPSGVDLFHKREEGSLFLENSDYSQDFFADRLKVYLTDYPDQTWFIGVFDEDKEEGNIIPIGFIVVTSLDEDDYAFVHQAYMKPDFPDSDNITRMIFHKTILWAQNNDKKGIKMETQRGADAWHRSYGFVEDCVTMKYDIPEDFELRLFSNKLKESDDGQSGQK